GGTPDARPGSRGASAAAGAQPLPASVADGSRSGRGIGAGLDQLLPQLALAGEPEEEPGERADRDERALEHHHAACDSLVGERRDPPTLRRMLVERIEDAAGPEEDVPEDRLEGADAEDIAELPAGAEPGRRGQHLDDRRPHQRPEAEEA